MAAETSGRMINQLDTVATPGVIQPTKSFVLPIQQPNPNIPVPEGSPIQIDLNTLLALMQLEKAVNKTEAEMVAAGPIATQLQIKANLQAVLDLLADKADLIGGFINVNQIPAIAIVEFKGNKANQVEMLATVGQSGDWVVRQDQQKVYVITGNDPTQLASWTALAYPVGGATTWGSIIGDVESQLDLIALVVSIVEDYTINFDGVTILGNGSPDNKYRVNPAILGDGGAGDDTVNVLARGAFTNQLQVDISLDYADYRYFEIILDMLNPTGFAQNLHVYLSSDGVAFDEGAGHYDWYRKMDTDKRAGVNGTDTALVLLESQGASTGNGTLEVFNADNAAVPTRLTARMGYTLPAGEEWFSGFTGRRKANVVTKAIRLAYREGDPPSPVPFDCSYIVRGIKHSI